MEPNSQLKNLFQFAIKTKFIVEKTLAADYFSSLFVDFTNLKKINRIVNPLVIGLTYTNNFF
jgi:hypothetical protein